jgi:lysophospholipase L1-like esterase
MCSVTSATTTIGCRAALLGLGLLALAACTSTSSEAAGGGAQAPLPTIGIGSDIGQLSGGANVRAIDAGAVESIVMIGDSITVAATPALEEQFRQLGFDDVTIVAQQDKRIGQSFGNNASGADIATFLANESDSEPEEQLWVVALGTNDISQYDDVEDVVPVVESVLAPIPGDAPVIWVNTYFENRPDDTAEVNDAIERVIAGRGNATIGQWNAYAPTEGLLRGDGVHPNNEGAVVFASVVTSTVANFLES